MGMRAQRREEIRGVPRAADILEHPRQKLLGLPLAIGAKTDAFGQIRGLPQLLQRRAVIIDPDAQQPA